MRGYRGYIGMYWDNGQIATQLTLHTEAFKEHTLDYGSFLASTVRFRVYCLPDYC